MVSFDVNEETFEENVIQASFKQPVVVDFWASWCGPCKALKPLLEKLATEYGGKFVLAKVDSDANQALSMNYGIRGIPHVKAFYQGQIINEFSGAIPESTLREFLDSIIPSPAAEAIARARSAMQQNQLDIAKDELRTALSLDKDDPNLILAQIELAVLEKNFQQAESLLEQLPASIRLSEDVKKLEDQLHLAENLMDLPSESELLTRIENDPENLQARFDLANWYIGNKSYQAAMDRLFEILQKNKNFADDAARKTLLSLFSLLEDRPEMVRAARRRLASILN